MGLDFIYRAKESIQRGWSKGLVELARPNLFTYRAIDHPRTTLFRKTGARVLSKGEPLLLRADQDQLVAYSDNAPVAIASDPPGQVAALIATSGGCALGVVESVHSASETLDVSIQ